MAKSAPPLDWQASSSRRCPQTWEMSQAEFRHVTISNPAPNPETILHRLVKLAKDFVTRSKLAYMYDSCKQNMSCLWFLKIKSSHTGSHQDYFFSILQDILAWTFSVFNSIKNSNCAFWNFWSYWSAPIWNKRFIYSCILMFDFNTIVSVHFILSTRQEEKKKKKKMKKLPGVA